MKKILVVTSSYPRYFGDPAGNFIAALLKSVRKRENIHFDVVAPDDIKVRREPEKSDSQIQRFPYFWPKRLQRLAYGSGMTENLHSSRLAKAQIPSFLSGLFLTSLIKVRGVDAIHAHWMIPAGLVGALIAALTGKPLVVTAHGSDLQILKKKIWGRQVAVFIFKRAKHLTVISENGKRLLAEILGEYWDEKKVQMIPMGITKENAQKTFRGESDRPLILYIGRLIPTKGVDLLLKAVSNIPGVRLLIAGDGYERQALERLAKNLGTPAEFLGSVERGKIKELLSQADCLVIPSRDEKNGLSEGVPLVLLEGLAAGCPVIATSVGGIPEVIQNGKNGILIASESVESLQEALVTVLTDENLSDRLRDEAKKSLSNYDLEYVAEKWENLYLDLTQQKESALCQT